MPNPQPKANERVLVDHTSPDGPVCTHVRGIVLANSVGNLKRLGVYDDYVRHTATDVLEIVLGSVAASWVPAEHVVAHYRACDRLNLTRESFAQIGAAAAERVAHTFMAGFLRRARTWGIDAMLLSVVQLPRLNQRMFKGGSCTIVEVGPKEVHIERHGLPFAHSRAYREGHLAFTQAITRLFCEVSYVRPAQLRVADPNGVAITLSWV